MRENTVTVSLDINTLKPMRELTPEEKRAVGVMVFDAIPAILEAGRQAALIAAGKGAGNEER